MALERNGVQAVFRHGSVMDTTVDDPHDLDVAIWCGGAGPAVPQASIDFLTYVSGVATWVLARTDG